MKKLNCLALVAVLILIGCKSNSFLMQRYTKFGHNPGKQNSGKLANLKTYKPVSTYTEAENLKNKETKTLMCSNTLSEKKENVKSDLVLNSLLNENKVFKSSLQSFPGNGLLTGLRKKANGNVKHEYGSKKTFKERILQARGIINTTLEIVLFIIILALVVAVIILVLLVG